MKRWLSALIPGPIEDYFVDLQMRLRNLETVVDVLIESPKYVASEDVGFNGQQFRKLIFKELLSALSVERIVETGTWIGNTTGFMAETSGLPVYTSEANHRFHAVAKARLAQFTDIHFELADSRAFLKRLSKSDMIERTTLFYLDAHWYKDLPLYEEIDLIAAHWKKFVLMVDDFKVVGDDGYGYDHYGKGRALELESIAELLRRDSLVPFFPSAPSSTETGARRGCVVIVREGEHSRCLSNLRSLVRVKGF